MTVPSPPGQVWMGGDFVAADCVLVWSRVRSSCICSCMQYNAIKCYKMKVCTFFFLNFTSFLAFMRALSQWNDSILFFS